MRELNENILLIARDAPIASSKENLLKDGNDIHENIQERTYLIFTENCKDP